MRRKDRQVTDWDGMLEVLDSCDCCRLGLSDGNEVYIVPLSFGYSVENGILRLFFHCAPEGRKLDLLRQNSKVSFEMDSGHAFLPGNRPCTCSFSFRSIMGTGHACMLDDAVAKAAALEAILSHYGQSGNSFSGVDLDSVAVIMLSVEQWSCKKHL